MTAWFGIGKVKVHFLYENMADPVVMNHILQFEIVFMFVPIHYKPGLATTKCPQYY